MFRFTLLTVSLLLSMSLYAQTNILVTNPTADQVLKGNFNPADYQQSVVIDQPAAIAQGIVDHVRPDSLKSYLEQMSVFGNRNTSSDTASNTFGIGAARRWAFQKFQAFSVQNENRLLVSYLQFDRQISNMGQHRNIFAVLPGVGPQSDEFVLIEGHFDSRCEDVNDSLCIAHGMEDNGSGSALVLELARVMSQYSYNRSVVFVLTIGEEQGLFGADAFATYCTDNNLKLTSVFNNDIVGGVICGETASSPGCPGEDLIDSVNVRIYSAGSFNSRNKSLARFSKLEYQENLAPIVPFQTNIEIQSAEDRVGRGGDHIPFRMQGFAAIRFTSSHEHGDGGPVPGYTDRQHTTTDVLGVDTDGDMVLDSFFVDFNYLARNAVINGNAAGMAATGPIPPTDLQVEEVPNGFIVDIEDPNNYGLYRVGIRTSTNDFDTVLTITQALDTILSLPAGPNYRISACTVDSNGIESLFSREQIESFTVGIEEREKRSSIQLLQNKPNPFDDATTISVLVKEPIQYQKAAIIVRDVKGQEIGRYPISLDNEMNEILYEHRAHLYKSGVFGYSLVVDGKIIDTKQMIFAY